jgi:hypothetical protein
MMVEYGVDVAHHPPIAHWVEANNKWWAVVHFWYGGMPGGLLQTVEYHDTMDVYSEDPFRKIDFFTHHRWPSASSRPEDSVTRLIVATTTVAPPWAIVARTQPDINAGFTLGQLVLSGDSLRDEVLLRFPGPWAMRTVYDAYDAVLWNVLTNQARDTLARELHPRPRLREYAHYLVAFLPALAGKPTRVFVVDVRGRPTIFAQVGVPSRASGQALTEQDANLSILDLALLPRMAD